MTASLRRLIKFFDAGTLLSLQHRNQSRSRFFNSRIDGTTTFHRILRFLSKPSHQYLHQISAGVGRLQAFRDGYTDILWRGKPAPDGLRYKALGNSMAVNVMRWLGYRIELVNALSDRIAA